MKQLSVRLKNDIALEGVEDTDIFLALLHDAPLKSEHPNPYLGLNSFSQDKENYYRIWVIEKPEEREVLTFAEARKLGILDQILDQKLEAVYSDVRKKDPTTFQKENGEWKPFAEVKNQVGAKFILNYLKASMISMDSGKLLKWV